MSSLIEERATVLFQGDSITDAGRKRLVKDDLGYGYAMMAASWFSALYPEKQVHFLNRGISGNRVVDLERRWQSDCLKLQPVPTWVSIMIGINDTWRRYDHGQVTTVQQFETIYRTLLESTVEHLHARLILCEPFVLHTPGDRAMWREDLNPKIEVVHKLAREFEAVLVPFDRVFAEAATRRDPAFWASDGVHPSLPGHALMAQTWLQAVQAL